MMNTSISRRQFLKASGLAAAGACAAGLLTGCGGSSSGSASGAASSGSGSSYTILYDSQPATLNYLTTGTDLEMVVGANCVDTLVEYDNKGVMREGLATSWDWDVDTLTWTFHLREENWVDCNGEVVAPVTAQDFVDALKYVLTPDYAASNVGLVTAYIAGADDYYNYHVYLNNANTGVVDDDGTTYTVDGSGVVTVTAPGSDPATYAPVDFDAVGVTAVDDHTLTYTLTYDFPGFLSLLCYLPYEPAYGPLLEETGDQFATSAETTYSCGAFYLAAYESLETWVMKKNPENYDADNVFIDTISRIYNAESSVNGPEMIKRGEIDEAKAKEYRDAAIPELTAAGVTFPIKVQMPYNPSSTDWDKQCQVFKQQLESVLNDGFDFIDIIITAGPSDSFLSSVRRNGKFAFLQCNWGADYSDPQTETDPFYQAEGARGSRYAFLRTGVEDGFITGDTADAVMNYMKAIEEAVKITDDINARYDAFANAEASLINNALVVPMGMSIPPYIATRLNYWEGQYASTGFSNKRLKGIHVLDHYISMSEYEANRDAR